MTARLAAIILAAGKSTRMGEQNKLLLPFGETTILGAVVSEVVKSRVDQTFVITGNEAEHVKKAIPHDVRFIHNPEFADGLSTSVKVGIDALPAEIDGVIILLGDMPFVTSSDLDVLIDAFEPGKIIAPTKEGKIGNPLIFASEFFDDFSSLSGDKGARKLLSEYPGRIVTVEITSSGIFADIDTLQAYEQSKDDT